MANPSEKRAKFTGDRIVYREFGTIDADSLPTTPEQELPDIPPRRQTLRIRVERKGRGGKTVSVVEGLQLPPDSRAALLKQLKSYCGSGGTVKDNTLELQGDHRQKLAFWLEQQGYIVKLSGQ